MTNIAGIVILSATIGGMAGAFVCVWTSMYMDKNTKGKREQK
jgi:hypothetical protein